MTWDWPTGGRRQTKQQREEIIAAYLVDPAIGTKMAVDRGLSPSYAYKVTFERGLLPRKREESVKSIFSLASQAMSP